MLPVFVFIALPTLSILLLCAIAVRKFCAPMLSTRQRQITMQRAMSRLEALRLLGLDDKADPRTIRAAYKRLIVQYHPDCGGSDQTAARLNLARDILLQKRKSWAA